MITALHNQTLFDLAVKTAGSAEAAYRLAVENGFSVTDDLIAGLELKEIEVANRAIFNYYSERSLNPATGGDLEIEIKRVFFKEAPQELS